MREKLLSKEELLWYTLSNSIEGMNKSVSGFGAARKHLGKLGCNWLLLGELDDKLIFLHVVRCVHSLL